MSKLILWFNLLLNLGILIVFKYFNFFKENLRIIFEQFGYQLDWFTIDVLLPVGISFYTFQAIGYVIDVGRGKVKVTNDFVSFATFLSYFPQLVAGPIEKASSLLPQIQKSRSFDYDQAVMGLRLMLWGFFKKIVIADNCAAIVNQIFENPDACNSSMLALGAVFFTFQIYGDFSGYTDIALGVSSLLGIRLTKNFNRPYLSHNIRDFWRRWHITLNNWFIDYVYIPLGGSRKSTAKTYRNILIVFFLSGLWHGASWTFVVWGLYHGSLLICHRIYTKFVGGMRVIGNGFWGKVRVASNILITFIFVIIGWIIFRASTLVESWEYLKGIFRNSIFSLPSTTLSISRVGIVLSIVFISALMIVEVIQRQKEYTFDISNIKFKPLRWGIYLVLTMVIIVFGGNQEKFIYFQF